MEPSKSAGSHSRRAAEKAEQAVMRSRTIGFAFVITLAVTATSRSPAALAGSQSTTAPISRTRSHVQTLASEAMDGRLTGTAGERLAADYIVSQLRRIGAKPLPGLSDYRLPFQFTAGSRDGGSSLTVPGSSFTSRQDVQALSFSDNGDASGPVVFAGYGLVVPDSQDLTYDSYAGLDVKDKVVLVLRYFPEDAEPKVKAILARYSDLRYKTMAARQHGAKAILVVTGPHSPNAGETVPMSFDTALAGSGIEAASISERAAAAILARAPDRSLESLQRSLDPGNPHVAGFDVPDVTVTVRTRVEREKQEGHNVVAYLPATIPKAGEQKPWVALGAHYDHLGHGNNGNSLARKEESGQTHFGADDNASGTAAVLAVGEALAGQPRGRNVLLDFWSGEEIGLIGSSAFAATPPVPLDQIAAYLNFDMVGRMQDNKLSVQAMGTSPAWSRIVEQVNITAGFDLQLQHDP
jgi:hypothetical protein